MGSGALFPLPQSYRTSAPLPVPLHAASWLRLHAEMPARPPRFYGLQAAQIHSPLQLGQVQFSISSVLIVSRLML